MTINIPFFSLQRVIMNKASGNVTEFLESRFYHRQAATTAMLAVFSVTGVFGNAVILVIYWQLVKMTTTQFLIFVIAIFDFITALVPLPIIIIYNTFWFEINSVYFCKILYSCQSFCVMPAGLFVFIVTFVRYCHICRPQSLHRVETNIKLICASFVMIGLFYSVLDASGSILDDEYLDCLLLGLGPVSLSRFVILAVIIVALVVLNVLIIIKNHQTKTVPATKRQKHGRTSANSSAQNVKVGRSSSIRRFFDIVQENQSPNNMNVEDESCSRTTEPVIDRHGQSLDSNKNDLPLSRRSHRDSGSKSCQAARTTIASSVDAKALSVHWNTTDAESKVGPNHRHSFSIESNRVSRTTVMICVVSLVYVFTFLPIVVLFNENYLSDTYNVQVLKFVILPLRHMYFLGCASNPVIYTFVNPGFRAKCRILFKLQ